MDIDRFRILYSELIENYQFIEMHLKDIYALIDTDVFLRDAAQFYESRMKVSDDYLKLIINKIKIKEQETKKQKSVIDNLIYNRLEEIRERRNYWCHRCFTDMVFDRKTGVPRKNI